VVVEKAEGKMLDDRRAHEGVKTTMMPKKQESKQR